MRNIIAEISPIDPATGLTTTIRLSRAGVDISGVELDGSIWRPVITEWPVQSVEVFSGNQVKPLAINHGELKFYVDAEHQNEGWSQLVFEGALARVWVGETGTAFASYTKVFEGACGAHGRENRMMMVPLFGSEVSLDTVMALSATYSGTGDANGSTTLKGKLKPRAFGACQNVAPVLIDPAYWIYQVNDGAIEAVDAVYELAISLGSPVSTQPTTYAGLKGLTLNPGQWAAAPALGMFRFGGQPSGKVTADIRGAKIDGVYTSTIATIVPEILKLGGIPGAKIDTTSFNAFSGYAWSLYLTDQASVRDIVAQAMQQVQAYAFADSGGVWRAGSWFSAKTPVTINQDRSTAPLLIPQSVVLQQSTPPVWKLKIGAERCWSVHSESDISSALRDVQDAAQAAQDEADAAALAAATAQASANLAITRLDNIAADNVLDRSEKAQIVREFQQITAEKSGINSTATGLAITTENTAYNNAFSALQTYLTGLSPAYTDTSADTTIVRTTWNSNWNAFYSARQALQDKIAQIAATKAGWGSVTGIPEEIADGRVGKGLTVDGDIQRVLPGSKLPGSAGNLIVDPLIADAAAWTLISNATIDNTSSELSTFGVVRAFRHLPSNGNMQLASKMVPAQPGATYNHTVRLIAKAGANATFQHTIRFYDRAGNYISGSQAFKNYPCGSPATDTTIDCSVTGVAPANTAFVGASNFMGSWSIGTVWTANYAIRPVSTPALVNIGDTSNMIPDSDFLDAPATWGINKMTVTPNVTAGKGSGVNKLVINSALGAEGALTANIPLSPGESIRCSIYIETISGTTGNLLIAPYFYNAAGGAINYGEFVLYAFGETGFYSSISKAPANTAFVKYQIYSYGNGNRVWHLSEPKMWRATVLNRDALRENGITPITDASAITAEGIAAGFVGQQALATQSTVNLATQVAGTLPLSNAPAGTLNSGISLNANGTISGAGGGAVTITGLGYTGALNATSNIITRSSTAPSSPANGDIWVDTSVTPNETKIRVAGAWQVGATVGARAGVNLLDSTGATLTDNAIRNNAITLNANGTISGAGGGAVTIGGLGYTGALNATANIITRSSTPPSSPANGDIWVDTSGLTEVTKVRVAGAWQIASNYVTDTSQIADSAGLGDTAVWNNVLDRPTSVATLNASDGAHLAGIETNADVTSQVTGTSEITISCDHTGAPLDGQLPKSSQFRLVRAGADVTTSATWSRSIVSGSITCAIGSSTGTLSISAITSDAVIRVAAALNGVTRVFDVRVIRSLAAPPSTGGSGGGSGGTAASDTTFTTVTSTAMATITDELSVTVGSSGTVGLTATSAFTSSTSGYFNIASVWQRWNGSAWVDLSAEVAGNEGYNPASSGGIRPIIETDPSYDGYFDNSLNVTGLTAGSTQKFRLRARGDVSWAIYFHTSVASVQG